MEFKNFKDESTGKFKVVQLSFVTVEEAEAAEMTHYSVEASGQFKAHSTAALESTIAQLERAVHTD